MLYGEPLLLVELLVLDDVVHLFVFLRIKLKSDSVVFQKGNFILFIIFVVGGEVIHLGTYPHPRAVPS